MEDDIQTNELSQQDRRKEERRRRRWNIQRQMEVEPAPELDPNTLAFFIQPVKPIFSPQERIDMEKRATAVQFVKQMLKYCFFLVIFTWVTISSRPSWAFECADVIRQTVLYNISTVSSISDIWDFIEGTALPVLFPYVDPSTNEILPQDRTNMVNGANRLMGQVRLRQIRIKPNVRCYISKHFHKQVSQCIAEEFSLSLEDKAPIFAPSQSNASNDTCQGVNTTCNNTVSQEPKWVWKSGKEACNTSSDVIRKYCLALDYGVTNIRYPSSGYIIDLPPPAYFIQLNQWKALRDALNAENQSILSPPPSKLDFSLAVLDEAKALKWMDERTVYVALEFAVYNAAVRIMTGTKASFEIFSSGAVQDRTSIHPVSFGGLVSGFDWMNLIGDIVVLVWVIVFITEHIGSMRGYFVQRPRSCMLCSINKIKTLGLGTLVVCPNCQNPFDPLKISFCPECYKDVTTAHSCWRGYFWDLWNYVDGVNLLVFAVVLSYRFLIRFDITRLDLVSEVSEDSFINLYPLTWQQGFMGYLNSVNMLITYFKALKYLGQIKSLAVLLKILQYSFWNVVKFLVLFFIVYIGFALAFFSAFGADLYAFRDITTSIVTMFRALLGQFDYYEMERVNKWLAPLLFLSFTILTVLILVNIFISILDAAYVKANTDTRSNSFDFLNSALRMILREWKQRLCCDEDHVLSKSVELLLEVEDIPELRKEEREDVRRFRKAMVDLPDHHLLTAVLTAFEDRPDGAGLHFADYLTLQNTVKNYKQEVALAARNRGRGVWEEQVVQVGNSRGKGLTKFDKDTSLSEIRNFWKQDRYLTEHLLGVIDRLTECSEAIDELLPKVQQWKSSKEPLTDQQHASILVFAQQLQKDWGGAYGKDKATKQMKIVASKLFGRSANHDQDIRSSASLSSFRCTSMDASGLLPNSHEKRLAPGGALWQRPTSGSSCASHRTTDSAKLFPGRRVVLSASRQRASPADVPELKPPTLSKDLVLESVSDLTETTGGSSPLTAHEDSEVAALHPCVPPRPALEEVHSLQDLLDGTAAKGKRPSPLGPLPRSHSNGVPFDAIPDVVLQPPTVKARSRPQVPLNFLEDPPADPLGSPDIELEILPEAPAECSLSPHPQSPLTDRSVSYAIPDSHILPPPTSQASSLSLETSATEGPSQRQMPLPPRAGMPIGTQYLGRPRGALGRGQAPTAQQIATARQVLQKNLASRRAQQ